MFGAFIWFVFVLPDAECTHAGGASASMANTGAKRWRGQAVDAGVPEGSLRASVGGKSKPTECAGVVLIAGDNLAIGCNANRTQAYEPHIARPRSLRT